MKFSIFLLTLLIFSGDCFSQKWDYTKLNITVTIDSTYKEERRQAFLSIYTDSLNNWETGDRLPDFLFDSTFENKGYLYWPTMHDPIGIRKLIFDKVMHKSVLTEILNTSDKRLDHIKLIKVDSGYIHYQVPFSEFSIRDLAKSQLSLLQKATN